MTASIVNLTALINELNDTPIDRTATTQLVAEVGDKIRIDNEIRTVTKIAGRWVTLDNGTNISRAAAAQGRSNYLVTVIAQPKDIVKPGYRDHYTRTVSANGNRTFNNGDELAQALQGVTLTMLLNVTYALLPHTVSRWDHLNAGQRSMNARCALRAAIRKGATTVAAIDNMLDQEV